MSTENAIKAAVLGLQFTPREQPVACECVPGSRERVEVYAQRVARGEEIFFEGDPTCAEIDHVTAAKQLSGRVYALSRCEPTHPRHFVSALPKPRVRYFE